MPIETLPEAPGVEEQIDERIYQELIPLYKIIMWNDEVTTMEFVVRVLVTLIGKDYETAEKLMYEIHLRGAAHVVTLPLEQAEFKVDQIHTAASLEHFPFRCTIEPA